MKNSNQATSVSTKEEPIRIGVATTPAEKREVYRFRYSIYAEEIGYDLAYDNEDKLLYEELDDWAILLTAHIGSILIGTARVNIGTISDFSLDIVETYRMDKFKKIYKEEGNPYFTVLSRAMISPQYRSSAVAYLFAVKMYELSCAYQVQFGFLNCNFHLISFYERSGYVRIDKNTIDCDDCSPLTSLVILLDDVDHLRAVQSPVFRTACKRTILNKEVVNLFHSEFSHEIKTTINSRLITPEELWTIMCQYSDDFNYSIPLLSSLSSWEAKLFLHSCGSIVHCHIGDRITSCGNISQELIILLSGKVHSSQKGTILPGEYCGDNGLTGLTKHVSTVIALGDLDILVLSYYNFSSFRKRRPDIARKILSTL